MWELALHSSRSLGKGGRVVRMLKRGREGLGEDGKRILGQITRGSQEIGAHNRRLLASIKAG